MISQAIWASWVLTCAFICFDSFRMDALPVRIFAFIAVFIGCLHGAAELNNLADAMYGRPVMPVTTMEVLIPICFALYKIISRFWGGQGYGQRRRV